MKRLPAKMIYELDVVKMFSTHGHDMSIGEAEEAGVLVRKHPSVAWLSTEDIGPSIATIVTWEEPPDYMEDADKYLLIKYEEDE